MLLSRSFVLLGASLALLHKSIIAVEDTMALLCESIFPARHLQEHFPSSSNDG